MPISGHKASAYVVFLLKGLYWYQGVYVPVKQESTYCSRLLNSQGGKWLACFGYAVVRTMHSLHIGRGILLFELRAVV